MMRDMIAITDLLSTTHPIISAPMAGVAGGRLDGVPLRGEVPSVGRVDVGIGDPDRFFAVSNAVFVLGHGVILPPRGGS